MTADADLPHHLVDQRALAESNHSYGKQNKLTKNVGVGAQTGEQKAY